MSEDRGDFTSHIQTVNPETFSCQQCNNRFSEVENMRKHMESKQQSEIICEECEKTFENFEALLSHMDTHHTASKLDGTFVNPSLLNSN